MLQTKLSDDTVFELSPEILANLKSRGFSEAQIDHFSAMQAALKPSESAIYDKMKLLALQLPLLSVQALIVKFKINQSRNAGSCITHANW